MPILEITGLVAVLALAWFWLDSLKARDIAVLAARRACESEGLQFLDESVSVSSIKPARDDGGTLMLRRVYGFEFSDTGDNRQPGDVVTLGHRVVHVNLGLTATATVHRLH